MPTSHPHTIPTAAIHPATAPSSPHRTINPLYQPPAHSLCSRVAVKALHEGSNLGELAQEVVDKCKLIHPSKVGPGTGEGREAGGRGACQQQEEKVLEQGMVARAEGQDRAPQGDAAALQGRGEGVPGGGNTKGHCWGPPIRGAVCKVVDHVDMMGSRAQGGGSVTRFVWCSNHQHAAHYV